MNKEELITIELDLLKNHYETQVALATEYKKRHDSYKLALEDIASLEITSDHDLAWIAGAAQRIAGQALNGHR